MNNECDFQREDWKELSIDNEGFIRINLSEDDHLLVHWDGKPLHFSDPHTGSWPIIARQFRHGYELYFIYFLSSRMHAWVLDTSGARQNARDPNANEIKEIAQAVSQNAPTDGSAIAYRCIERELPLNEINPSQLQSEYLRFEFLVAILLHGSSTDKADFEAYNKLATAIGELPTSTNCLASLATVPIEYQNEYRITKGPIVRSSQELFIQLNSIASSLDFAENWYPLDVEANGRLSVALPDHKIEAISWGDLILMGAGPFGGSWPLIAKKDDSGIYVYFAYFFSARIHRWTITKLGSRIQGDDINDNEILRMLMAISISSLKKAKILFDRCISRKIKVGADEIDDDCDPILSLELEIGSYICKLQGSLTENVRSNKAIELAVSRLPGGRKTLHELYRVPKDYLHSFDMFGPHGQVIPSAKCLTPELAIVTFFPIDEFFLEVEAGLTNADAKSIYLATMQNDSGTYRYWTQISSANIRKEKIVNLVVQSHHVLSIAAEIECVANALDKFYSLADGKYLRQRSIVRLLKEHDFAEESLLHPQLQYEFSAILKAVSDIGTDRQFYLNTNNGQESTPTDSFGVKRGTHIFPSNRTAISANRDFDDHQHEKFPLAMTSQDVASLTFSISEMIEISSTTKLVGDVVDIFHSFSPRDDENLLCAFRRHRLINANILQPLEVITINQVVGRCFDFSSKKFVDDETLWLNPGEDPRLFKTATGFGLLSCRPPGAAWNYMLFDITNQRMTPLEAKENGGWVFGKNWQPFIKEDELYAVTGFDPFRIIKIDEITGVITPIFEYSFGLTSAAAHDNFSYFRGGSSAIFEHGYVHGFGHMTMEPGTHIPFHWKFKFADHSLKLGFIDVGFFQSRGFQIIDPTSFFKWRGSYWLGLACSNRDWFYGGSFASYLVRLDTVNAVLPPVHRFAKFFRPNQCQIETGTLNKSNILTFRSGTDRPGKILTPEYLCLSPGEYTVRIQYMADNLAMSNVAFAEIRNCGGDNSLIAIGQLPGTAKKLTFTNVRFSTSVSNTLICVQLSLSGTANFLLTDIMIAQNDL